MKNLISFLLLCIPVFQTFSQITFNGNSIHGITVGIADYSFINAAPQTATIAPESYAYINHENALLPYFLGKNMVAAKDFIPIQSAKWVKENEISEITVSLHRYADNKVNPKVIDQNVYFFDEKGQLLQHMAKDSQNVIQYTWTEDELKRYEVKSKMVNMRMDYTYQHNSAGLVSHFEKTVTQTKKGLFVLSIQPGVYSYDITYNELNVPIEIYLKKDSKMELFKSVREYADNQLLWEDICSRTYQNVWHHEDTFDSIMCAPRYVYSYNDQGIKTKEVFHYPVFVSGVGFVFRSKPVASSDFKLLANGFVDCTSRDETGGGSLLKTKYRYDLEGNLLEYNKGELEGTFDNRLVQQFNDNHKIIAKQYFLNGSLAYAYIYQYDKEGKISQILSYGMDSKRYDKIYIFSYKEGLSSSLR